MPYLNWDTKKIDLPPGAAPETPTPIASIEQLYDEGYVATRVGKGIFNKTRSFRVRLAEYAPSSENRRIMRKALEHGLAFETATLPYERYHWTIHKMAKDFYTEKFGADTFSANKVREMLSAESAGLTDFNSLLVYRSSKHITDDAADEDMSTTIQEARNNKPIAARHSIDTAVQPLGHAIGYCIGLKTPHIFHYSYPFYNRRLAEKDFPSLGLSMMTQAVEWAKAHGLDFIYLGSLQRPSDTYKLQFSGGEWFDGERWQTDTAPLKKILAELPTAH